MWHVLGEHFSEQPVSTCREAALLAVVAEAPSSATPRKVARNPAPQAQRLGDRLFVVDTDQNSA